MLYPVRGVSNNDPLYMTQVQVSIDTVYLLCTCITGILIAVGRSKGSFNEKRQNRTLYLLYASMFLIGVTTVFAISSGSLLLADAYVSLNYQMFKGVFALFYFPGEAVLIATILSALSHYLGAVTVPSKRLRVIRLLYKVIVGMAFILSAILIFVHFSYAQRIINAVNNGHPVDPLSEHLAGWSIISLVYRGLILIIGLNFLMFSLLLFKYARRQPSTSLRTASLLILFIVSPAIIIHSLFGTTMNGLLYQSLPFEIADAEPYSWPDLINARIDPVCFSSIFAAIGWILIKHDKPVVNIYLSNTRDPENGTSHT